MPDNQPSIGELVSKTVTDAKRLVTAQLALAKAEMQASKKAITAATALGLTALILAPLAIVFLLFTLAYGLQQMGLQTWAAFGIVSLLILIVIGITAALAVSQAKKIKGPELAIRELNKTAEAFGQTDAS
jgi:uncharacterized membrane protein YqjE